MIRVRARPPITSAVLLLGIACSGTLAGCAPRTGEPSQVPSEPNPSDEPNEAMSPAEAQVLAKLTEMPTAKEQAVGELKVVADAPYAAASGKTCRRVLLTQATAPGASKTRLACRESEQWAFVPSVFAVPEGN